MRGARGPAKLAALVVYIIVILVATPQAQQSASFSGSAGSIAPGPAASAPDATTIELLVGRSTILNVGSTISRVSLTVPDIADAMVTTPQQLLIHGKQPGTISLFVWDKAGGIKTYEVSVHRDLKELAEHMKQLFPGEPITVAGSGKDVVLSGTVSSKYIVDKASDLASGYVDKKENVVNLMKQQEGVASNQVMLRVRFAEVSRSALQELGASFVAHGYKSQWYGRTTTQQFPAPEWDHDGKLVFSDFLNLFLLNSRQGLGGVIRALQSKGLFQSLAEPNLVALNGKEASFLAGGEYPYPVAQPSASGTSITVQFKEFGIRLTFTPTVLGNDLINLKVRPEVSTLDFSNAITLDGFRLPALSTRRTETEVELADGQTFAIAGLMNNTVNNTMQKIPGIGDIPILGYLFRSRAYQKNQTELVVMITPTILRRGATGVSEGLPSPVEQFLGKPDKTYQNPAPYTGSPRFPATANKPAGYGEAAPAASAPTANPSPAPSAPAPSAPVSGGGVTYVPSPNTASAPLAPAAAAPSTSTEPMAAPVDAAPAPAPRKMTKDEKKAADAAARQRTEEEKARARADEWKRAAEEHQKGEEARRAQEDGAKQAKLDQERAKREAEVARKSAEVDKKKADEQKKREKALSDAADRLRQAQAAYEAELQKTGSKGGANDKSKGQDKDKK